jgi:hypothetical protein
MFLIDNRKLKFMSVCAYMHNEILIVEEAEKENKGEKVIEDKDNFVRNTLLSIKSIVEEQHYTYDDMLILYVRFPQIKKFYDSIGETIKKHVKTGEGWIPALVILSVLQEFTLRGYKQFKFIPFTDAIDKFILSKKANSSKYLRVAGDIYDSLTKLQYKRPKNNNRKRKNK